MQITPDEKTIEGDLFTAFVEAGAISKANANDPKKSQLVRCARTDKGVHAAGNIISLKLIVEDEDVVEKINFHLSSQIRIWGIQRTVNSFSAYQACDSRRYEYLIPTHSFLSPHPNSYLAKKLKEIAEEAGDLAGYEKRQKEMEGFWEKVEEEKIKPILDELPEDIKGSVLHALYETDIERGDAPYESAEVQEALGISEPTEAEAKVKPDAESRDAQLDDYVMVKHEDLPAASDSSVSISAAGELKTENGIEADRDVAETLAQSEDVPPRVLRKRQIDGALRSLRKAYQSAKRAYRIQPERFARIQPILNEFLGTKNFHNYTIEKSFHDPSAKRHIRTWNVNKTPIVIKGTEWLSLKIHGQSFMMHQIRKMVGMVALVVRCGCDPARIRETFRNVDASIPKAPALGLLLERPVFDSYNDGPAKKFERDPIGFEKYEEKVEEFKNREIYQRQFDEEEEGNQFHQFFAHADNLRDPQLLYLSSRGFDAVKDERKKREEEKRAEGEELQVEGEERLDSDDEQPAGAGEGREG